MDEKTNQGHIPDRDDDTMAKLLRLAGPQSPIPDDIEARVYERVSKEWRASSESPESARVYSHVRRQWAKNTGRNGYRRWILPTALAASAIMALAVVLQPPPPVSATRAVGTVARVIGGERDTGLPALGAEIQPGDRLETGEDQGISLLLGNAESLRLDEGTILVVETNDSFRLIDGRVYADTGDFTYRERGLVIETTMGSVTDVGTQFSVGVADDLIDVAVREGRVDVDRGSEQIVAVAGERVRVHRSGGATVDTLAAHDGYWDWATSLAPAFDLENKSLLDFLRWAARETGTGFRVE